MKEAIEDYIARCEKRVITLEEMLSNATEILTKERLIAKKSVYLDTVRELRQVLEDEDAA